MLRIAQIKLSLDEPISTIPDKIIKKLHIKESDLLSYRIFKESIDARSKKQELHFTYSVDCKVKQEEQILKRKIKDVTRTPNTRYKMPDKGVIGLKHRPVVIGFGPAGMFAALLLAQMGYEPLVLERGECVEKRVESVERFWKEGILNTSSNVQFGEGGAGTFSDGKLTARSKDLRVHKVLSEFVNFGAPEEILYQQHPHIGTDKLRDIVKNIREEIIKLNGTIRFETKVEDILIENDHICGIIANGEVIACEQVILAIGHSARDTFYKLMERGVSMQAKAFAIGARIEHPQTLINQAQYKEYAGHPRLQAAEYRMVHTASNGRGVYTFCMCPGGLVVPSTSIEHGVVVNGMSEHARDQENANSALLVQVHTSDFNDDPRLGIQYQEQLEHAAYTLGGSTYQAPAQLVKDFLAHRASTALGSVTPSYVLGIKLCDLHDLLPDYISEALAEGIKAFDQKLHGFAMDDAVLTGIETRSSSPIRLNRRKEDCISRNVEGLYPCGEGAGYAGGIVSAAIDGLRCAESLITMYHYPLDKE